MRSMTGYGRGEGDNGALNIVIEVKAVNHRYSEITIKQPRQFLALEDKMKKVISSYIERVRWMCLCAPRSWRKQISRCRWISSVRWLIMRRCRN